MPPDTSPPDTCTTREVARLLGLAVRSVQLMVDRGELEAWKTSGGHRRISRASVERWIAARHGAANAMPSAPPRARGATTTDVLLIEDSVYYQAMVRMLLEQAFPEVRLHVVGEGIAGLAMVGQLRPAVLIVDILLPGIDGATLVMGLRSHPQFRHTRLLVITSLDEEQRRPYAFALADVPVIHKSRLTAELAPTLAKLMSAPVDAEGS